ANAIKLPARWVDDSRNPDKTRQIVAGLIRRKTSKEWRPIFTAADCCATIVATSAEAMCDPHFVDRGLVGGPGAGKGRTIAAFPVPIASAFCSRKNARQTTPRRSR